MSRLVDILQVATDANRGDIEAARLGFDDLAADGFRDIERDEHWLTSMSTLAELAFHLGDAARGEELRALLAPYADRIVAHDLLRTVSGSVHTVLGQLSTLVGRFDEAVACYERALEREAALGAPCAVYGSEAGLARALEARGAPGDRDRARTLWDSAEQGFERFQKGKVGKLTNAFPQIMDHKGSSPFEMRQEVGLRVGMDQRL